MRDCTACKMAKACQTFVGVKGSSSLSDLRRSGCKSRWPIHISPIF